MSIQEIRINLNEASRMKLDILHDIRDAKKKGECNVRNVQDLKFWNDMYKKCRRELKAARRMTQEVI